jgi:hypothetical protein
VILSDYGLQLLQLILLASYLLLLLVDQLEDFGCDAPLLALELAGAVFIFTIPRVLFENLVFLICLGYFVNPYHIVIVIVAMSMQG